MGKKENPDFDVGMGSFDGAETCDIVVLYILSQLRHLGVNIGMYKDDGLAFSSLTPRQGDVTKKKICKVFAENELKITIDANMTVVDFLDVTLDISNGSYKPYAKPNCTPQYINIDSNHTLSIIKNIPLALNKRLSEIFSD